MQMDTHYGIYHIKRWNVNWILQEKWKVVKLYTDTDGQPIPKSLADWRFMCWFPIAAKIFNFGGPIPMLNSRVANDVGGTGVELETPKMFVGNLAQNCLAKGQQKNGKPMTVDQPKLGFVQKNLETCQLKQIPFLDDTRVCAKSIPCSI